MVMESDIDKDDVQDLGKEPKRKRRGFKLDGTGKTIGICILAALIISTVISFFVVNSLSASKDDMKSANARIYNAQSNISILSTNLVNYATVASLTAYAKTKDLEAYAKAIDVENKLSSLNNSMNDRIAALRAPTHKVTIVTGYCNISVRGSITENLSFGVIKEYEFSNNNSILNISTASAGWNGWNINGIDNYNLAISVPVTSDVYVVASGAAASEREYALKYSSINGWISGNVSQSIRYGGNGSIVWAYGDNSSCFFNGWSDGVMTAYRTDTNVHNDISVTANFVIH